MEATEEKVTLSILPSCEPPPPFKAKCKLDQFTSGGLLLMMAPVHEAVGRAAVGGLEVFRVAHGPDLEAGVFRAVRVTRAG